MSVTMYPRDSFDQISGTRAPMIHSGGHIREWFLSFAYEEDDYSLGGEIPWNRLSEVVNIAESRNICFGEFADGIIIGNVKDYKELVHQNFLIMVSFCIENRIDLVWS